MPLFKNKILLTLILIILFFYNPFFLKGFLPIPADTIVGMYHPFRDKIWNNFTSGVPFKNPLITDPVRQQYVWRSLALAEIKKGSLPVWNPYSFSGTPLLANFQSASLYPLNFLYFIFPDSISWTLQIIISHLLIAIFLYYFLINLKVSEVSALFGSITFSFSGFTISWLTWNTIDHIAAWTILSLLSIDKILSYSESRRSPIVWFVIFVSSITFSFLAGHLQIFFYGFSLTLFYLLFRISLFKKNKLKISIKFLICVLIFILFTLPQSIPTLKFIAESAREVDQGQWAKAGWFIPIQNLMQFLAPDIFGNPVTGNYFGIWNYAEFVGFIGIFPLIIAMYGLFFIRNKNIYFFAAVMIISGIFANSNPLSAFPFIFKIPLISTSQPTRLIFIIDLSLAVLTALGMDYFISAKKKLGIWKIILPAWGIFISAFFLFNNPVSHRNLILPIFTLFVITILVFLYQYPKLQDKSKVAAKLIIMLLLFTTVFEVSRFAWKFTPFTRSNWLFPQTQILSYLASDRSKFRIMALDRRIMPPNFSVFYNLEDVAGYDPLYLKEYNLLVSSWNSGTPQDSYGGFNRIVTPDNWNNLITDLMNVKYILTLNEINSAKLKLVLNEGSTYLYYNNNFFPRAWLVDTIIKVDSEKSALNQLFDKNMDFRKEIVTSENIDIGGHPILDKPVEDTIEVESWTENRIVLSTNSVKNKLLVLSEIFSPLWEAKIDGIPAKIYKVNYLFRGIPLTSGPHNLELTANLL